jgi:hypothetical protein
MPELLEKTLEDGRAGLLRFISEGRPQGSSRNSVTVVFDGSEDVWSIPSGAETRVLFSKGESADDLIKRLIEEAAKPRELVLVSDDRELVRFAGAYGAEVWTVVHFLRQGRKRSTPRPVQAKTADGKVISEVFRARVDREFERIWLKKQ